MERPPKIALVHDFLLSYGGAERVLQILSDLYPKAPIYTLLADAKMVRKHFPDCEIRTSFLQKLPLFLRRRYRWLLPFYPVAVETLDLREYDVVFSSSGAWTKGIVTRLKTKHIAYLHSPMRFVWDTFHSYPGLENKMRICRRLLLSYLRLWDREAAARPDILIANSGYTAKRIQKYYGREASILYPPTSIVYPNTSAKKDFFLVVSRLTSAKRIGLVIDVFNKLGHPLVIVGNGPEKEKLENEAMENIRFVGWVDDTKLSQLYSEARALIQPSVEDFGLAVLEALTCGTPVIAQKEGGVVETLVEGKTGEFFESEIPEALADAVRRFSEKEVMYDPTVIRESARKYSRDSFELSIQKLIREVLEEEV